MIKSHWYQSKNFGDTLTPIIVEHFLGEKLEYVNRHTKGKLLAVGSIMSSFRDNDVVWGAGAITDKPIPHPRGATVLAVRGPLTRSLIKGYIDNNVYGDPALLLPLIYKPEIKKKYKLGIIPHYVDKNLLYLKGQPDIWEKIIDIEQDWKKVIEDILGCEAVLSSSLHGIIAAEAYGVQAAWAKWSDNIIGGQFKFQDYFQGTGRSVQPLFKNIPPIQNLKERQELLINQLKKHYGKN